MIKIQDNGRIQIEGEPDVILSQVRILVEALADIKEFKDIYNENGHKLFDPTISNSEARELINKICEEVYENGKK